MDDILERFPDRESFDKYWKEKYVPLTYEDVQKEYEDFVEEAGRHIFDSDYEEGGCIKREDFAQNLSQAAAFTFQDTLTEAFYDKNPELYETAFELYEMAQLSGQRDANAAITFHEEFDRLYHEFLNCIYDKFFTE